MNGAEVGLHEPEIEESPLAGRSYLLVDYGHSTCKATLYDLVEGYYRLIGRGEGLNTAGPPWFDIAHGMLQAIGQISDATGRKLLTLQGQLIRPTRADGSGIDYFGATVSLGDPLRVVVAGLLESASITSARKALQTIYAQEVACFSPNDGRGRPGQIESLLALTPDVVFLVGGTDGGAGQQVLELATTIAMALELQDEWARPVVIYGGNAALRSQIMDSLGGLTEVRLVNNVRPSFEYEQIEHSIAMLADAYYSLKLESVGSSGVLADWCNTSPMISAHAFGGIAEYLAAAGKGRVIGVDVGSSQVTLISAVKGQVDLVVRPDLGLGRPVANILDAGADRETLAELASSSPVAVADYVLDKSAHPGATPLTTQSAKMELAIASQMVRQTAASVAAGWSWPSNGSPPEFGSLLLRGRVFTGAGNIADALISALDGLRAWGVFRIIADDSGLLPAMGFLAGEDPEMVVQILGGPDLERLGWVIAVAGRGRQGETALKVTIKSESLNDMTVEVPTGDLEIVPLPVGETITVVVQPSSRFDIGAGPGRSRELTIVAGTIGLIIDGRGELRGH